MPGLRLPAVARSEAITAPSGTLIVEERRCTIRSGASFASTTSELTAILMFLNRRLQRGVFVVIILALFYLAGCADALINAEEAGVSEAEQAWADQSATPT